MKVLWLTNKIIPRVHKEMGLKASLVNEGWISEMFSQLCKTQENEVTIVCGGGNEYRSGTGEEFDWYVFKEGKQEEYKCSGMHEQYFNSILTKVNPDIIHIWGTEYPHTLAMINAASRNCLLDRVVVSIQGLISKCAYHYYAGLPPKVIYNSTFYDIVRRNNISVQKKKFEKRGLYEVGALRLAKNVIGRTYWDNVCVKQINPGINYYKCNETLRNAFYSGMWSYDMCDKHRIFVSQASYSIKGFHMLLFALPKLIEKYPDLKVYVGGINVTSTRTIKDKLKLSSYGRYIKNIIKKNALSKHVFFLGQLNAESIKEQYLKANVFVSCSSVENSSNSVGEAMILGVPIVSSNVGGISTILVNGEEGYTYPYTEYYMLGHYIDKIFENPAKAIAMGTQARKHALNTHDKERNFSTLMDVYAKMCN